MIKNKFIKKIALGLALAGVFTTGAIVNKSTTVSAAETESTFNIDSVTGDYVVLNPTDYYLRCKNQGTVGTPITFKTNISGYASGLSYTYTFSNRAEAKPGTVYGPYSSETLTWTPETAGLYAVQVKCQDAMGNVKYFTQYVEIQSKLSIDSYTSDHACNLGEYQGKANVGETINISAEVSGGYGYTNKKYTYRIIPRNASPDNLTVVHYNLPSSELAWTPKYPGIYAVNLEVKDEIGNKETKYQYFIIDNK